MIVFRTLVFGLILNSAFGQSDFISLSDSSQLYLEESGSGQTILFIPGWTMTHRFFENQQEDLSDQYHVVTYDPRGQGLSSKTDAGHNYAQHARDLREILITKNLNDVILVGWSNGCLTAWEYIRAFGKDRIQKVIFIDEPPKWVGDPDTEWVYGTFEAYRGSLLELISGPGDPEGIINWMLEHPVDSLTMKWMREEIRMTPRSVAINLYINGLISDYTEEVAMDMPALYMVRSSWFEKARSWLSQNAPHAKVKSISSHAMFWERPEEFNLLIRDFINSK